ncbi:MAG: CHAD domain-containing protein [Anaerolineae bacterium]|nr:CHAD domain-containing protein [Anaerolineae bacterium]
MEIEAKFSIPNRETYQALQALTQLGDYTVVGGKLKHVTDTYLDTGDHRILAAGYACRLRQSSDDLVVTLKAIKSAAGPLHKREELEIVTTTPLPPHTWPDSPVRSRVLEMIGDATLTPLCTLQQNRFVRMIHKGSQPIAELSLDHVTLMHNHHTHTYMELEIELKHADYEADLGQLANHLQTTYAVIPEPRSKFERALAFVKGPVFTVEAGFPMLQRPGLNPDDTMTEAARKIFRYHFQKMLVHEPGTRSGEDIEALHDMRVATRRMRAAFRIFGDYLDMQQMKPYLKGLRRTGRALGVVRDMDVFMEKTQLYLDGLSPKARPDLRPLIQVWELEYAHARAEMAAYLDGKRYQQFKETFGALLDSPLNEPAHIIEHQAKPYRVRHSVPLSIYRQLAEVRAYEEWVLFPNAPIERYHNLRIAAKRLRYTLEYFREVLVSEVEAAIAAIKILQNYLGDLQDAIVASARIRNVGVWGTWNAPPGASPWITTPIQSPGVSVYLAARQTETQKLLRGFPVIWQQFQDSDFNQLLAKAISML